MPLKWFIRFRKTGQLTVFDKAGGWSPALKKAIATFNGLNFGVKLVEEKNEREANIVVMLSNGADSYPHPKKTIKADFPAEKLHGEAHTLVDAAKRWEIEFAVIFLPGKIEKITQKQQEVVIVHEFIHAAGLNGLLPGGAETNDHDDVGIMFSHMVSDGDGLIEYLHDKDVNAMPPIRVGSKTMCKMRSLWAAGESCPAK